MARPLRVISLLSRLGDLPLSSINGCRFASRGGSRARMGQMSDGVSNRASRYSHDRSDDEPGLEDVGEVEDKLQALFEEERKMQKTVKYHILRRKMTPPGAPHRKLTWDAIEQIRYLKQEQPDEWTVERLAEGYSVTPDVILRVLRSKFVPPPERRVKQDFRVMAGLGQQVLPSGAGTGQDRLKLPGKNTTVALPPGGSVADRSLMLRGEDSESLVKSPAPVTLLPTQFRAGNYKDIPVTITVTKEEDSAINTNPSEEDNEDEESWDGRLLTDKDLEELMEMAKPQPVVQVGNEVFDAEGSFLYRI